MTNNTSVPAQRFMSSLLAEVIRRAPVVCTPATPIRSVLETMRQHGIGSVIVTDDSAHPVGIFTVQDVLNRIALSGHSLDQPVATVMTRDLATLPPEATAYEAVLMMAARGIHHIVVVDKGKLLGIVSERDLFSRLAVSPREVGNDIRHADRAASLRQSAADIRLLAHDLLEQGVGAAQVTQLLSSLNDLLTQRIIAIEAAQVPLTRLEFCWIAMGSEGRYEQTFNSDQDNGIIFTVPPDTSESAVRDKLLALAQRINQVLDECGFALCRGNIMAGNPQWCLSLGEWQERFADWIDKGDPVALLNASIFFDFRPLYGAYRLAEHLRDWLRAYAQDNSRFLLLMTQNALTNNPPLGLVRDFRLTTGGEHPHTLDLKVNGITPFVDAARIYALAAGVTHTNTTQRLRLAAPARRISEPRIGAWLEAFQFIQLLRLRLQLGQTRRGAPVHNMVDPDHLNAMERRVLMEAMRQARDLQSRLQNDFAPGSPAFGA